MNTDPNFLERRMSDAELEAALDASLAIVAEVEAGRITREQAKEKLVAMGGTPYSAAKFLRHTLDQEELDAERARTGRIVD